MAVFEGEKAVDPKTLLKVFYAVTKSKSVYLVRIGSDKPEEEAPLLVKISKNGESKLSVGGTISNGTMIAVGKNLQMFVPEGSGWMSPMSTLEREVSKVNTHFWGGHTSLIVALFLNEAEALDCSCESDLQPCDARWRKKTSSTLKTIGDNHPYCSISTAGKDWWLIPPEEWHNANGE